MNMKERNEKWKSCLNCRFCDNELSSMPCAACWKEKGFSYWEPEGTRTKRTSQHQEKEKSGFFNDRRPKPMPNAAPYYDRESSRIPDRIRVSFTDGTTAVYTLHIEQPAPMVVESLILREEIEYEYKPRRRRRTRE